MAAGSELFTLEVSHGKPRLIGPRPSALGTVPTGDDRRQNHDERGRFIAGNSAAGDRSARQALTRPLRAATARLRETVEGEAPAAMDRLLADAGAVYASSRRELGTRSTLVLSSLAVHATESVLAGHFVQRAAEVGLDTDAGARLLGLAHGCETQAARAMTAALAATKALAGKRQGGRRKTTPAGFEEVEGE